MRMPLVPLVLAATITLAQADWTRFRGPNGSGIYAEAAPVPTQWSETQNLKWKAALPGPGNSSPIVTGDRVFITCWTGYGTEGNPGEMENLERHLLCYDRNTGQLLWDRAVKARLPEDRYGGMFAQHGYATHTPVTDGERVIAFFGKSGVHAYDLDGNALWQALVGDGLDGKGWGSSSSPILYNDLVIVLASPESAAVYAFDKKTGAQRWKSQADGYYGTWGTPAIVKSLNGEEIVLAVPGEIWGLNPETGKLRWYCAGAGGDSACASPLVVENQIVAQGDRGTGSVALKVEGKGDLGGSGKLWSSRTGSRIATPVLDAGKLYWVASGIAYCMDAATGAEVYRERVEGGEAPAAPEGERRGGFGGGRGFGGGGGDYASPVLANGHIYQPTRGGEVIVYKTGPKFELVSRNRFESDKGGFSASPAVSDGCLFLRTSNHLYCVGQ